MLNKITRDIASYSACALVSSGTATSTTTSLLYLFALSPSKNIQIQRVAISAGGGSTNGSWITVSAGKITAQNGVPGGTTITAAVLDRDDPASVLTGGTGVIRSGAAAPTRIAYNMFGESISVTCTGQQFILFSAALAGRPIILRSGENSGFEVKIQTGTLPISVAVQCACTITWTEV